MRASKLIEFLQDIIEQHGDYEVWNSYFDDDGDTMYASIDKDEIYVDHDNEEIIF